MSTQPQPRLTPAEYLAIERAAEFKSEYFDGEMFAMAGANRKHNRIAGDIFASLHNQLQDGRCEPLIGDMRVKVSPTGLYTYPDIVIVCDEPQFEDAEVGTLLNPNFIVEVLSKSTENYDRGGKFAHYQTLDSFREYLLVAQDCCHVEHFVKQPNGDWLLSQRNLLSDPIEFPTIGCTLKLADAYARVEVPEGIVGLLHRE